MDRLDLSILRALVERGRITANDLGEQVGLSATACARRVQQLESKGFISSYRAVVGLEELGFGTTVMLTLTLESQTEEALDAFERAIGECSSVMWCFLMSGTSDYIACVVAKDIRDFERIHREQLSRLPGVARLNSSFALRQVLQRAAPAALWEPHPAATARRPGG